MVIELYVEELMGILRTTSHREVAEIPDVEARYRAEAGSEKLEELYRCLSDAASRLEGRCMRFLKETWTKKADNVPFSPEAYVFEFVFSERRAVNKGNNLREAMNTFVVEYALSKFYSTVSQTELSNKHSLAALDAGNTIDELLYTKQPPRV